MIDGMIFYILALLATFGALMTITRKNPVESVLYLVFTFFVFASFYITLSAEFLAAIQIIVYAGAIMVLFLFVVMLLDLNKKDEDKKVSFKDLLLSKLHYYIIGGVLVVVMTGVFRSLDYATKTNTALVEKGLGTAEHIGFLMFTKYAFPFEVTSILLVSAMVGVVVLVKKKKTIKKSL